VKPIGVAVVGVGDVAQRDYLPEFERLGEAVRLIAVSSRSRARAEAAAERYGAARWSSDWRELLADDVDVVVNLTPIQAHVEITLAAIEQGKHVYSEKPLASDRAAADEIARAAATHHVLVAAAPSVLLFPQVRHVATLLASAGAAEPVAARARMSAGPPPWEGYLSDPTPFFAIGGGPLRDMGIYALHAVTGLLGPVRRVTAMSRRVRPWFEVREGPHLGDRIPLEVDDDWHVTAELTSGPILDLHADFIADPGSSPELELFTPDGGVAASLLDVAAPIRVFGGAERGWSEIRVPFERTDGGPDHILGVRHLIDCVRSGRPNILSVEHAAHVIDIIAAAERSAADGVVVAVSSTFPRPHLAGDSSEVST
jgi:predicted dehydrogenase